MKAIELEPLNLGEMEKRTPEFQRLTVAQQNARRDLLFFVHDWLRNPSALGLSDEQASMFMSDLLEFHLSGKVGGIRQEPKPLKPRSHRTRKR